MSYEVRDGLGQVHTFDTSAEAEAFARERRTFTWANVFPVR
ncbi:hypothetical protein SEA_GINGKOMARACINO_91 [Mycobacterium phage GingkoMaracino]|nr:hypothetical protein SEA_GINGKOMARACINO_91 [Mycobacterium phage GingkoMaracino]